MKSPSTARGSSKSEPKTARGSHASRAKTSYGSSQQRQLSQWSQINLQSRYDPKYCAMLLEHMAAGYCFTSFAAVAKVAPTTIMQWVRQHQAFADAKALGEASALHYKEKLVYGLTTGQLKGDLRGAIFLLKTDRSREYSEQVDVHVTHEENLSDEQLESEIKRLAMRADVIDAHAVVETH